MTKIFLTIIASILVTLTVVWFFLRSENEANIAKENQAKIIQDSLLKKQKVDSLKKVRELRHEEQQNRIIYYAVQRFARETADSLRKIGYYESILSTHRRPSNIEFRFADLENLKIKTSPSYDSTNLLASIAFPLVIVFYFNEYDQNGFLKSISSENKEAICSAKMSKPMPEKNRKEVWNLLEINLNTARMYYDNWKYYGDEVIRHSLRSVVSF